MATAVNNFFLNKIVQLKKNTPVDVDDAIQELDNFLDDKNIPDEGFELKELTENYVTKLLKKIKGKKSCGLDWIYGYSLKIVANDLIPEIKELINITIRNGSFTPQWKIAKILPAFKNKGKNCSTTTALQQMIDTWIQSLDDGKIVAALFLDLSAGFDVINHDLLLKKLERYKFTTNTMNWFKSYLTDRHQAVQVESATSPLLPVPYGVPQGSILGPLLFLIFINELPEVVKIKDTEEDTPKDTEADMVIYADDNTPFTADKDPTVLQVKVQEEADIVANWFEKNDMVVSGDKTKLLILTTAANRSTKISSSNLTFQVSVCGEVKVETQSEKLLGITLNNQLTWKNHLYGDDDNIGLIKQLSQRIGMMKQIRKFVNDKVLRTILNGLFNSKLIYGITVYGGIWGLPGVLNEDPVHSTSISKEDMRKLQVLQNTAIRLLLRKSRDTPVTTLMKEANLLSVHQLVAYHTACQVFKIYQNKEPAYHYSRLFSDSDQPETRSATNLESRVDIKLSLGRNTFFYQAAHIWTALPYSMKTALSIDCFKKMVKPWIMRNITIRP